MLIHALQRVSVVHKLQEGLLQSQLQEAQSKAEKGAADSWKLDEVQAALEEAQEVRLRLVVGQVVGWLAGDSGWSTKIIILLFWHITLGSHHTL